MDQQPVKPFVAPLSEQEGHESDLDEEVNGDTEDDVVSVPKKDWAVEDAHEDEIEEAQQPLVLRDPGQPTQRERKEHEVALFPFKPWCK